MVLKQIINWRRTLLHCIWKPEHRNRKNTAASEGADAGQASEYEDTEDTRELADPAPMDEQCELKGADDSLAFKTWATNVTQMHF